MNIVNRRNVIRRTSVAGKVPTIPSSAVTSAIYPDKTWADTDLMVGELALNITDEKAWVRFNNRIVLLGYSGMTSSFVDLDDVPPSYATFAGQALIVNTGETGLEFSTIITPTGVTYSSQLLDMPNTFLGVDYMLYTTSANTYEQKENTILNHSDVNITGHTATHILVDDGTYYTSQDPLNLFVDLNSSQYVYGQKEFDTQLLASNGIQIENAISFIGITENTYISNISTDTGFTAANNDELASSLAIKQYVDLSIAAAAGITGYTGNWVTTNTIQNISAAKTFDGNVITNDKLECNGTITANSHILQSLTSYTYWGNASTNGSYRMYIAPSGNLTIEKRISGSWTFKASF